MVEAQGVKRRLAPDTRLDWRDPNMPVLRYGKINGVEGLHEIEPEHIKAYYHNKLAAWGYTMPDWKDDPTYNMRRKK